MRALRKGLMDYCDFFLIMVGKNVIFKDEGELNG